jgi:hypothetical protein
VPDIWTFPCTANAFEFLGYYDRGTYMNVPIREGTSISLRISRVFEEGSNGA